MGPSASKARQACLSTDKNLWDGQSHPQLLMCDPGQAEPCKEIVPETQVLRFQSYRFSFFGGWRSKLNTKINIILAYNGLHKHEFVCGSVVTLEV